MLEQLITVATFNDHEPAAALCHRLEDAGIPSQVFDESTTQRIWFLTKPKAYLRVRVDKDNEERATRLIKEWDKTDHVMQNAICCPECGSSRVEYPQYSRRTAMTFFFAILNVLHIIPRQYYCRSCHFTWAAEPEPPKPDLDILNWHVTKDEKEHVHH
jgi:hypothetical protein